MDTDEVDSPEHSLGKLIDSNFVERNSEDRYEPSAEFIDRLERWESDVAEMTDDEIYNKLHEATGDEDETEAILTFEGEQERLVAEYLTLCDIDGISHAERLRLMSIFDTLLPSSLPTDGTPDAFLSVDGNRLPFLLSVYDRAIVYIWRNDCPPCDIMRDEFNEIFTSPPDDLALLSVYGPDCAKLLQEEYGVTGGPVTLFTLHGRVDARLNGAQYPEVIETEIEKHRELGRSE